VKELSDPEKDRRTWIIHMRNRQLEDENASLHERLNAMALQNSGAMDAGAPLGGQMGGLGRDMRPHDLSMQWPAMGMGYGGAEGMPAGFAGAGMVMPRSDTPAGASDMATYAPSDGIISPFPQTESPAASFTDMDPASRIEFASGGGGNGGDDLGIGSDLASRQYFLQFPNTLHLNPRRT
jgi:hypothetical protein